MLGLYGLDVLHIRTLWLAVSAREVSLGWMYYMSGPFGLQLLQVKSV